MLLRQRWALGLFTPERGLRSPFFSRLPGAKLRIPLADFLPVDQLQDELLELGEQVADISLRDGLRALHSVLQVGTRELFAPLEESELLERGRARLRESALLRSLVLLEESEPQLIYERDGARVALAELRDRLFLALLELCLRTH